MMTHSQHDRLHLVMKPTQEASGLDNSFYTSRDHFITERNSLFTSSWAGLMFTSQLPQTNQVKPVEFMGLPLLIVNNNDAISIFHNVCRHRGHKLVTEEKSINGAITCPYHFWTYKPDGSLITTPHIGGIKKNEVAGFNKQNYSLVKVNHGLFMNVLYINIDNSAGSFEDYLTPLTSRWQGLFGKDSYQHMIKGLDNSEWSATINCNWKLAVENYCEAYHLPSIHPELNSYSPIDLHYNIEIDDRFSGQGTTNYLSVETQVNDEKISLPLFTDWDKEKLNYGEYISLYPNVLIGIQTDHAFSILLTPINEHETREQLEIYYVDDGASHHKYQPCREITANNWQLVFAQDISPIESMQAGRQSPGFDGGCFSPALDVATHHFHRWVASHFVNA